MADKKTSTIVATSLISVVGLYVLGTAKTMERKAPDPGEIMVAPLVLDPVCISLQDSPDGLSKLKTANGDDFFTCEEVMSFKEYGGTFEYAKELASMKDAEGKDFFTGYDLVAFKHAGGTAEYAQRFDGSIFSGKQLPMLYRLGLHLDELVHFKDTAKPNALLAYPTLDKEGAFFGKDVVEFFN